MSNTYMETITNTIHEKRKSIFSNRVPKHYLGMTSKNAYFTLPLYQILFLVLSYFISNHISEGIGTMLFLQTCMSGILGDIIGLTMTYFEKKKPLNFTIGISLNLLLIAPKLYVIGFYCYHS